MDSNKIIETILKESASEFRPNPKSVNPSKPRKMPLKEEDLPSERMD